MLSGTMAAMSGRISVGCKSPLTGGIKESNSGGQASQVLARLGYAAIILEGKPKENDLYKIFINKDGVEITIDNSLKMLGNYDLVEKMKGEYGDKIGLHLHRAGRRDEDVRRLGGLHRHGDSGPPATAGRGGSAPSWAPRGSR